MLVRLTPRERFEALVAQFEPKVRAAFLAAVDDITSNFVLRRVVERLERGDVNGAVRAMNLDEAAYRPLEQAIAEAYTGGGVAAVEQLPELRDPDGFRVVVRFGVRNTAGEAWLRDHSATLVRSINADQQEALRTSFEAGLARGDNPTRTALNVAGRVNPATGRREGGIVGLTAQQSRYVENARDQLLSGDPAQMRAYFERERRDRRFDRTVQKAINEGKPLSRETVDKIVGRYSDGMLKLRADTIGMNETMTALSEAKEQAFRQQIGFGRLQAADVTKTWRHTPQENGRLYHIAMQGQTVRLDQPFQAPDGTLIPYPHAPGVPARHTLGCKCFAEYKVDFAAPLVRR